jgi:hypothetical protein
VYGRCTDILRNWCLVNKTEDVEKIATWVRDLERRSGKPPEVTWETPQQRRGASLGFPVSNDRRVKGDSQVVNNDVGTCDVGVIVGTALS